MHTIKRLGLLVSAAFALTVGACADKNEPFTNWTEPASYQYVLRSNCGERLVLGEYRITVDHGKVTAATGLDETGRRLLSERKPDFLPTIGALLAEAEQARANGADVVEVTTDPATGQPTKIDIDPVKNATDDEGCYFISDLSVPVGPASTVTRSAG
jgi:hypothetical protein